MDIDFFQALCLGHLQQGKQVLYVRVYAAVRQQAVQVQAGSLGQTVIHRLVIGRICKKGAVINGAADPGQILEHHAAAADVGVPHLAVAHLSVGQTHIQAGRRQCGVGIFSEKTVKHRCSGHAHGIVFAALGHAEAVHDNQCSRRLVHAFSSPVSPDWLH